MNNPLRNILNGFMDTMAKRSRYMPHNGGVMRLEEQSVAYPDRINVMVQASSFVACQMIVSQVMEEHNAATFTIPVKADNGQFCAIGHYQKPTDRLPEF